VKLSYSERFQKSFRRAPASVQKAFAKQAGFLLENLQHPSLRAKKYDEANNIWQGRVNKDWRFYFSIEGDEYRLHDIMAHPK
jgi:mRNA-degrading endonuclease RelE of RelBE toxin-antitoxin system